MSTAMALLVGAWIGAALVAVPLLALGYRAAERDNRRLLARVDERNRRLTSENREMREFMAVIAPHDWEAEL